MNNIMTYILRLVSILGVFFMMTSTASADFSHPNMYVNANEINNIKEKVAAGQQPWKAAYDKMISDANNALNTPIQSVTFGGTAPPSGDNHDYFAGSAQVRDPGRYDYTAAITMSKAVRNLGLAYAFTGDSRYADKAVQLINAWTVSPDTKMNPKFTSGSNFIEYTITLPGMWYGADLIWNYHGWNSADRDTLKSWTAQFIIGAKGWCGEPCDDPQNYENWRLVFISSASVIAEDSNSLTYASNRWKEIIPLQMDTQGKMRRELERRTSLDYSLYAINAMTQTAEIARHNGIDLYNYKLSDGRGLEKALDFHAPYVANPDNWPYPQSTAYNGGGAALYELAYSFKNKQPYKDVIVKWKRPMYETRTMGPVTLTHADTYFNITNPNPTPTGPVPTGPIPTGPSPTPVITRPRPTTSEHTPIIISFTRILKKVLRTITPGPVPIQSPTPVPSLSPTPSPTSSPIPDEENGTWTYRGVINIPYGRLHNNIWGATDTERQSNTIKSYIYYKRNGNFGWEWNRSDPRPDPNTYVNPIYPEIIVGTSGPFSSTLPYFPITVKDINSLTLEVSYNYTKPVIGKYNLAYDIWLVDNANAKKAEVMIWIYGDLGNADNYVSDGINEYGYFYRPPSPEFDWDYHAFVLKNQDPIPLNHKVNIKNLLNTLISSGTIDSNWKMLGIEFGNEIGRGSGRIEINKFLININGNKIGKI